MQNEALTEKSTGICGAKTRGGAPCQKPPAEGRTRCRLHGGASPRGMAHPRFKHGGYSCASPFWGPLARAARLEEKERRRQEVAGRQRIARFLRYFDAECERIERKMEAEATGKRGRGRPLGRMEPNTLAIYLRWSRQEMQRCLKA
jgi:hypothetical protein